MEILRGNLMFGQSGGPTAVINTSAAGVFTEALKHSEYIGKVYGAAHGIVGILGEDFYDIGEEDPKELEYLRGTPSSILGSCRYKLADAEVDDTDYKRILEVFKKYDIRYFFYNGGNDSMDTCNKISKYLAAHDYECRVIGVPKTVDNDLALTDHCPGFGSAAKYVATTAMEVTRDAHVYDRGTVIVMEIMGRHAGWLAAAAALASYAGDGPDLIYLPEVPFELERMMAEVKEVYEEKNCVVIAVSEGVQTADGRFIPELVGEVAVDSFGHKQLGGTAQVLADYIGRNLDCKKRGVELSLMQRSASHIASGVDIEEAFMAGAKAVEAALAGKTDLMVAFERQPGKDYKIDYVLRPLAEVANKEDTVPREWINEAGNGLKQEYIDYALPLIQGQPQQAKEMGLPRFARFKKVQAGNPKK